MTTPSADDDLRRLLREAQATEVPAPPFSRVAAPRLRASRPRLAWVAALAVGGAAAAAILAPRPDVSSGPRVAATVSPSPRGDVLPADGWSMPTDVLLPDEPAEEERRVEDLSRAITVLLHR